LFTVLLAFLEDKEALLPHNHPYASVLEAIRQGSNQGTTAFFTGSDAVLQAIREFVATADWPAARRVVEARQEWLFQPEAEQIFLQNIAQAQQAGEKQVAKLLETHLAILLACQRDGIEPTFASLLTQADETSWPFDPELIPKSIAALLGVPQEKFAYYQYLITLVAQTTDAQFQLFLTTIQQALVGVEPSQLGQDLTGRYRDAWEHILKGLEPDGQA
jgi:hypothetical protein